MPGAAPRIVFDTSALLDLFGVWSDDHRRRRGDLVLAVPLLGPLRPYLTSSEAIREEVHRHLVIGTDLERYLAFLPVDPRELTGCPGYAPSRAADYSLVALAARFERAGDRTFLITRDRTFVSDLARAGLCAQVVLPTGFAEAVTTLAGTDPRSQPLASRLQSNAYENLEYAVACARREGSGAFRDWQQFLNARTAAKHDLVESLRGTGVVL